MIEDLLERSSWGFVPAGGHWLLVLVAGLVLVAVVARASWGGKLRSDRGLSLLETLVVGLLVAVVVLAVIVLT